jgi:ribonuclease E
MDKRMLIDAAHPEETRVVVLDGGRIEDFDYESQSRRQLRGNIYLAKVTRVEPSLQAAFVEYGGNRHGFLAFNEIHPDYYQIPTADREALLAEEAAHAAEAGEEEDDDDFEEDRRRRVAQRRYKIQEVIKRRQIMLVQVVKEERGNKGAALTTYLSLAGRYGVLMPNTGRGGGISRKITNAADRKRLKKIAQELEIPEGMGLIVRTAGAKRTKTEIKRDYEYLMRLWENIRALTLKSIAPKLIHEEGSLVKRALRDLYDKDVESVYVEGDDAYREAKDFVRMLMPSHSKKVHLYKDNEPLFVRNRVEEQLETVYSPVVQLRSGGSIVINQTEALVAIDVNSGRSTRERSIESTALRTNLEAAEEACRQMRLRDLAGLIVIDFIDMEEAKNDRAVEKRMQECLRLDRARVQTGKISAFGLLEISRQRRRTGILEGSSIICPHCSGAGRVRSTESSALKLMRALEQEAGRGRSEIIFVRAPTATALYLLNEKRDHIAALETRWRVRMRIEADSEMIPPQFEFLREGVRPLADDQGEQIALEPVDREQREAASEVRPESVREEGERDGGRRRRRRRGGRNGRGDAETAPMVTVEDAPEADNGEAVIVAGPEGGGELAGERKRRRRRGRRGGRRRREDGQGPVEGGSDLELAEDLGVDGYTQGPDGEDELSDADAGDLIDREPAPARLSRSGPAERVMAPVDAAPAPAAALPEVIEPSAPAEPPQPVIAPAQPVDPDAERLAAERRDSFLKSRFKWFAGKGGETSG